MIPDGTLLDGEYLESQDRFIAFDVLRMAGRSLEGELREFRLRTLSMLGLPNANESHWSQSQPSTNISLQLVVKGVHRLFMHLFPFSTPLDRPPPVSFKSAEPLTLHALQHALSGFSFPSDGLIFSSQLAPYGSRIFPVFKWQAKEQVLADLSVTTASSAGTQGVFELRLKMSVGRYRSSPDRDSCDSLPRC